MGRLRKGGSGGGVGRVMEGEVPVVAMAVEWAYARPEWGQGGGMDMLWAVLLVGVENVTTSVSV